MKKVLFSLLFVLYFAIEVHALTTARGGVNVLPEPLPETPGQLIYEEMGCPICHGHQGGGDGFMSEGLNPKPRNFTDFKVMSRLSDMTMAHSIRNGIPGTGMPAWSLTDNQINDVISYIKTFLADSQTTIGVCLNEQREIDVGNLNLKDNYAIGIDQQEFLKVASQGNRVIIEPKDTNVMRHFRKTRKSLVRTHVMINGEEMDGDSALIVVRIRDCFK
ncbi:MAG: cytochrome c [Nitrospinota bacterium]|nr:cytochrome c [Nitrospinota bacterium]